MAEDSVIFFHVEDLLSEDLSFLLVSLCMILRRKKIRSVVCSAQNISSLIWQWI